MCKKIFFILVAGMFILGMIKLSFAMTCHSDAEEHSVHSQLQSDSKTNKKLTEAAPAATLPMLTEAATQSAQTEVIDAGNKICPVTGEKIEEKTKATYEYEGKIYNFCCAMCIEEFKKDPEKYIKKVEEGLLAESKEEKPEMETMQGPETSHQDSGMHGGHHH